MKFKVHLQRYVEETTTITVEADTIHEAVEMAEDEINNPSLLWSEAGDILPGVATTIGGPAFAAEGTDNDRTWTR